MANHSRRDYQIGHLAFWAIPLLAVGCVSSGTMRLSQISTSELPGSSPKLIAIDVEGSDCGGSSNLYGDYAAAVEKAIASAPGANALVDASFFSQEYFFSKLCVHVRGNAVVFE
jgi:hypothetical protein